MRKNIFFALIVLILASCSGTKKATGGDGWIALFDGKSLAGWRAAENPATFSVENGAIAVHGPRAHLFYEGPVQNHDFKNFELKVRVMTAPGSNSGIFIHTRYQDKGWPAKGYEVQVNNSHTDWRRTGSLYAFQDVREVHVQDNEWYTEHIIVQDKKVTVKINDKTVVDYTEPDNLNRTGGDAEKKLSSGTIALQGHDPGSKVYFKEVLIRPL